MSSQVIAFTKKIHYPTGKYFLRFPMVLFAIVSPFCTLPLSLTIFFNPSSTNTKTRMFEYARVVMGLAYTSNGGCALYIECQGIKRALDENGKFRGGGNLATTGNLKDVMKESTKIANTVARARLADIDPNNDYFDKTDIHMHCPEGV